MREFTTDITEQFVRGLPQRRSKRTEGFLDKAYGVVCRGSGIYPISPLERLFSNIEVQFPFPQLIHTPTRVFLAHEDFFEIAHFNGNEWITERLSVSGDSIIADGAWHYTSGHGLQFFFNGTSTVWFKPGTKDLICSNSVPINTATRFKGRYVLGGFDTSNFWTDGWQGVNETWKILLESLAADDKGLSGNHILWSSIGGGDFPLALFDSSILVNGDPINSMLVDRIKRNEMGFAPMPMPGDVLALKTLGNNMFAFQTGGVSRINFARDLNTFGFHQTDLRPVASRTAVGSNGSQILYVTNTGHLTLLQGDGSSDFLDFSNHISELNLDKVKVTWDGFDQCWYIADQDRAFIFTGEALTEAFHSPTSIIPHYGDPYSIYQEHEQKVNLITGPIDLGYRGLKTLNWVTFGGDIGAYSKVRIHFRMKKSRNWQTLSWEDVGLEGNAFVRVTALEFKIELETTKTDLELDYVQLKWQRSDVRYIRGPEPEGTV